jgi:hypothetical protein
MSTLALPDGLTEYKTRTLPDGALIEFETAPAGGIMPNGEIRRRDYRAYYYTPAEHDCLGCAGTGRIPGKRPGTTKQCPPCSGTGFGAKRVRLPSVTTLLDAICPKPGLVPWAEARGIEGAIEAVKRGLIDPSDSESVANAVETVRTAQLGADRARDDSTVRGLNVHACLEHYLRTGSPPNLKDHPREQWGYLQGLSRFLLKYNPEPEGAMVEELVAHPELGYAGRLDFRARCNGPLIGWDAKTQERGCVYLGAHAQLNLYEQGAIRCGDEPADELRIVVFAADGNFYDPPANHGEAFTQAALAWVREGRPVDALCAAHNRARVEERA